jgi:hypothetical protein
MAGVFAVGNDHPLATTSTWHLLGLAVACAGLSWLLGRRAPSPPVQSLAPATDDEWERRMTAALRGPGEASDHRVRTLLREARSHAAEAGTSLQHALGDPEEYAAGFGVDRAHQHRRTAWFFAVMTVLWVVSVDHARDWISILPSLVWASMTVGAFRKARATETDEARTG